MSDELVLVQNLIHEIRGKKVMLDFDLAKLYHVTTGNLNQAVKRNINRFPSDFMFQLDLKEFTNLKSQNVISSWGGTRKLPHAFTEQGVAMLSSVLHSETAIQVNISIMRAFVKIREYLLTSSSLSSELKELKSNKRKLMVPSVTSRKMSAGTLIPYILLSANWQRRLKRRRMNLGVRLGLNKRQEKIVNQIIIEVSE